ncbi:uncharacterized protein LOC135502101 [Lineus longissimus]|uniref:uncharacterized protein LOC135502101 n=1 Tax=Lineus longissimus TaxID=88925 RepID=UPI002B4D0D7A
MASKTNQREEVAEQLHDWMVNEMKFKPQGRHTNMPIPSKEALLEICRGPMLDIWKYVTSHVKSSSTIHTVKGNLALHSKPQITDGEKGEKLSLYEKRQHLLVERDRHIQEQIHLEKDLERRQKEVLDAENAYRETTNRIKDMNHRSALLQAHSEKIAEEVHKFDELNSRIRSKIDRYKSPDEKSGETVFFSRNDDKLESACSKKVRESCEATRDFFHLLLQGKFNTDPDTLPKKKDRLWTQVEDVMLNFPITQIHASVILNADETAHHLSEMTRRIDIKADAEKLRFKYEVKEGTGHLLDKSVPPSLPQSVHKLLEESQSQHIARFLETQKSKNQVRKLEARLKESKEEVQTIMEQSMYSNPGALELAKVLFDVELEEVALRTKINGLQNAIGDLQETIVKSEKEREQLYSKQQQIQDFRSLAEKKQNLITVLVKQNVNGKTRLEDQRHEIQRYIQNTLCSHEVEVTSLVQQLYNSTQKETATFSDLTLPYLALVTLDSAKKIAVINLSIHRLSGGKGVLTPVTQILDALEFPTFKAPECLLNKAIELKEEVDDLTISYQRLHASGVAREQENTASAEKFKDVCDRISQHDRQVVSEVLPQMKQKLKRATDTLGHCINVKDLVNTWWDQPGQDAAPWLKVNAQTLQQWKHKWTIAVSKLRLMEMNMMKDKP